VKSVAALSPSLPTMAFRAAVSPGPTGVRSVLNFAPAVLAVPDGVVVRKDFATEYPEVVVAYIKALIEADAWVRSNPTAAAAKIEEWTKIEKEVAYLYLGPGGIHTLDPTIKPRWLDTIKTGHEVLTRLNRVKPLDINAWVNETYVRQAFKELKLDYDAQKQTLANYDVSGNDPLCKTPITRPKEAGEVWIDGAPIAAHASPVCTLAAVNKAQSEGKKVKVAYLNDKTLGIKLFADKAFYAVNSSDPKKPQIVPFLLKKDALAEAAASGGRLATYPEALAAAAAGL